MGNSTAKELKKFLLNIIVSDNTVSSKRAITLAAAITLVICSFLIPILLTVVIFTSTKGDLELIKILAATLSDIIEKNFYMVLGGLGMISSVDLAAILKSKAKLSNVKFDELTFTGTNTNTDTEVKGDDVTVLKDQVEKELEEELKGKDNG